MKANTRMVIAGGALVLVLYDEIQVLLFGTKSGGGE